MSPDAVRPELRPVRDSDLDAVLELNERWVPHVGTLDRTRLEHLVRQCSCALLATDADATEPVGAVLVLAPDADYASPNYRWFSDRHAARRGARDDGFRYVDRIAVAPSHQGRGIGRGLYGAVVEHARTASAAWVFAEVNVDPPNPASMAFHRRLGFVEVGRRGGDAGSPLVSMLELAVPAS